MSSVQSRFDISFFESRIDDMSFRSLILILSSRKELDII